MRLPSATQRSSGQPRSRPYSSAARKASPQPVGSTTSVGRDAGHVRALRRRCHSSQPSAPSVTTTPRRCERDSASSVCAGALAQHLGLVVVDRDPARLLDEAAQLGAVEHRQALARIEDERDAGGGELRGVLQHRVAAVGRDDADAQVGARRHRRSRAPTASRPGGRR